MNPFAMIPLLKKSFFPPAEESEEGDKAEISPQTNGSTAAQTAAIENQASYENGDQVVPIDVSPDEQQQAVALVTSKLNFSSTSNSAEAVNSLNKQLLMAKLA